MKLKRPGILKFKIMKKQYGNSINLKNIELISSWKIKKILKNENREDREIFLHNILDEWITNFNESDTKLFSKLKKLIKKTKIKLNDIESNELFILEERAFSEIRQIKIIEVNMPLKKNESVGIKYDKAKLYSINGNKTSLLCSSPVLVSNKRIIFENTKYNFSFSQMEWYSRDEKGFIFKIKNKGLLMIRIHDQRTLNNSMYNILKRKVKNDIKERKNY